MDHTEPHRANSTVPSAPVVGHPRRKSRVDRGALAAVQLRLCIPQTSFVAHSSRSLV